MNIKRLISQLTLVIQDFSLLVISFYLGYLIRRHLPARSPLPPLMPIQLYLRYIPILLIWIITFYLEGLYTKHFTKSEELIRVAKSTTISSAFGALLFYTLNVTPSFSRLAFVISYIISILLIWAGRLATKSILYKANIYREKAIIWGNSRELEWLKRVLEKDTNCGIEVAFHLKDLSIEAINNYINTIKPRLLFIGGIPLDLIRKIEHTAWQNDMDIIINAFNHTLNPQELDVEEIFGYKGLRLKYNLLIPRNAVIKRIIDLLVSMILIILLSPLFILISVLVKITSKGPIFFTHKRLGVNGKPIKIYKFRTMYENSEEILHRLFECKPELRAEFEKYRKIVSIKDPRVTALGRFLRKSSLDELPQLFNVLKGEMSLVGPRPYLPEELPYLGEDKDIILSVKPGLTGLWQVSGRNQLTFEERVMLESYYVKNWNLFLDLVILVKTVFELFKSSGAY
ncbi:MAG: exopolysaccharide biosynthesis polyprenyl glycosylphosphotransferase [candidate division WOR-3 bacterium]